MFKFFSKNFRQDLQYNQNYQDPAEMSYSLNNNRNQYTSNDMRDYQYSYPRQNLQRPEMPYTVTEHVHNPFNNPLVNNNIRPPMNMASNQINNYNPPINSNPMPNNNNQMNKSMYNPQISNPTLNNVQHMNNNQIQSNLSYQTPYQNFKEPNSNNLYIHPQTTKNYPPQQRKYNQQPLRPYKYNNNNQFPRQDEEFDRFDSKHSHKRKHHSSTEKEIQYDNRKMRKKEKKNKKKKNHDREKSNSSSDSVEVTYMSYSKFKGNNIKMKKISKTVISSSSSSSDSESSAAKKKNKLKFECDTKPVVLNDEKAAITLNKNIERKIISYKIVGYERPLITQEKNLFDKMKMFLPNELLKKNSEKEKLVEPIEKSPELLIIDQPKPEEKEEESIKIVLNDNNPSGNHEENIENENLTEKKSEQEEEIDEFNFDNRYFIKNPTKLCFRCHKTGHYEKTCTEELIWNIRCMYCLGDHGSMFCDSIVCFKCSKTGHKNKDCPLKFNKNCNNCNKTGHDKLNCGVVEFSKNHFSNKYQISDDDNSKLKCFVCMKTNVNHVNCKKILIGKNRKVDDLYEAEIGQPTFISPMFWRGKKNSKEENIKKFNYQKVDPNAMDSMEELENF